MMSFQFITDKDQFPWNEQELFNLCLRSFKETVSPVEDQWITNWNYGKYFVDIDFISMDVNGDNINVECNFMFGESLYDDYFNDYNATQFDQSLTSNFNLLSCY